jgi:hypothetical protein
LAGELRGLPPQDLAPVIGWDDFHSLILTDPEMGWRQNQHIGLIGPTEQGKTNLLYWLLQLRTYVTFFATKIKDETLDAYAARGGYQRLDDWPPRKGLLLKRDVTPQEMPRRLLWPDATTLDSEDNQRRVFTAAYSDIYRDGGWCCVWDDFWYLANILGFERDAKKMLLNARSNDIAFVLATQRPAGQRMVEIFDQASHLYFFRDNDEANLKRIGGVGWLAADPIKMLVANLERYQFLWVHTRLGLMYRCTAPELTLAA